MADPNPTLITITEAQRIDVLDYLESRFGKEGAVYIWRMAHRLPDGARVSQAVKWGISKWEERETAILAGTGYDPDDEYRYLPLNANSPDPGVRYA